MTIETVTKVVMQEITCPHCEGTTRALNFFDPLEFQQPSIYVIDRVERSPSGREMYDWKCEECRNGKMIVLVEMEFPIIDQSYPRASPL